MEYFVVFLFGGVTFLGLKYLFDYLKLNNIKIRWFIWVALLVWYIWTTVGVSFVYVNIRDDHLGAAKVGALIFFTIAIIAAVPLLRSFRKLSPVKKEEQLQE